VPVQPRNAQVLASLVVLARSATLLV